MLTAAKFAFKAYGLASGVVHTIKHPIQAVQDSIRGILVKVITKAVMTVAGNAAALLLKERANTEKLIDLRVNIPSKMRGMVLDEDALQFATQLVNDALSIPLGALGLSLGTLSLSRDKHEPVLRVTGSFKLAAPIK